MQFTPGKERVKKESKTFDVWLWLFLGYVLFWYLQGGFRFPVLGSIRFEFLLGLLLSVAAVFRIAKRGLPRSPIIGWIAAFIIVTILATVFSVDTSLSWTIFLDRVIKFMMMGVFIVAFVESVPSMKLFLGAYLLAFLKMAQEGIVGLVTGSLVWENQGTPRLHGATPNYAHPNSFAGTQLANIPFFYFLFPLAPLILKIVFAMMTIAALLIVVFSGSRTAYVALFTMVMSLVFFSRYRKRAFIGVALFAVIAVPLVPDAYWERFNTIITQEDKEGASIDTRRQIFDDAIVIWKDNPLGVGVGAFPKVRVEVFSRSQDTHNLYLELATNLGVQGLLVFIGLVVSIMRSLWRTRRTAEQLLERIQGESNSRNGACESDARVRDLLFIRAVAVSMLSFIVTRLTLGMFGHDLYEVYWWFSAGMALALERLVSDIPGSGDLSSDTDSQKRKHYSGRPRITAEI